MAVRRFWRSVVGVVVIGVLVGALVQPAAAEEVPVPDPSIPSEPVVPDESEPAEVPAVEAPEPADPVDGSVSELVTPTATPAPEAPGEEPAAEAVEFDLDDFDAEGAEVLDREEFSQTYKGPDGVSVTRFSDVPLNVRIDGRWKPVSTDVQGRGPFALFGAGGGEVVQHPLAPVFAERADETPLLTVTKDERQVEFTLVDAAASRMSRDDAPWSEDKDRVEYANVFAGTDLIYEVGPAGVKELFELAKAPGGVCPCFCVNGHRLGCSVES